MPSKSFELKVDPVGYVEDLESPIGVYLRRIVFQNENKDDKKLRRRLYGESVRKQSDNGSWDNLFVNTANSLWDLGLLGYDAKEENVKKGLDWLLSTQKYSYRDHPGFFYSGNRKESRTMRSTMYGEFGPGCTVFYTTTYAVHLFNMFGLENRKEVQQTVDSYLKFWTPEWCGSWCTINVLRMLIEHPKSTNTKRVRNGIKYLADIQTKTGAWKGFPFYHTFHALSRSSQSSAKKQLDKVLPSLARRQNKDGSWGRKEPETRTFLVLDGLKNAGQL